MNITCPFCDTGKCPIKATPPTITVDGKPTRLTFTTETYNKIIKAFK